MISYGVSEVNQSLIFTRTGADIFIAILVINKIKVYHMTEAIKRRELGASHEAHLQLNVQ